MRSLFIIILSIGIFGYRASHAANMAFDSAADPAYSNGWMNGSNGGYGFGPWILTGVGTNYEFVIQSSTVNGDGDSNGDGDIDTGGYSWGLAVGDASIAFAIRPFTGGDLSPGQTFSVDFDFGYHYDPSKSGMLVGFFDSSLGADVFGIYVRTNSTTLFYTDALNDLTPIPVGNNDEGFRLIFFMTGLTNYQATIVSKLTGSSYGWSGTLSNAPAYFVAQNASVETGSTDNPYRLFINSMEIVPEPRMLSLILFGGMSLGIRRAYRRLSAFSRRWPM